MKFAGRDNVEIRSGRAFTLVETLVTLLIIGVLLALLLPTLQGSIESARAFRCSFTQRSVAFDFNTFGDPTFNPDRGDDAELLGGKGFRLETFMESQYGIDEFWYWGSDVDEVSIPDRKGNDPLRCPEVGGALTLRADRRCSTGGVTPAENLSFAFNMRLHREAPRRGLIVRRELTLTQSLFDEPGRIPLLWDLNGSTTRGLNPTPIFGTTGDRWLSPVRFWHPSYRHRGAMNVAFVDGHVDSTRNAVDTDWRWEFVPTYGRRR